MEDNNSPNFAPKGLVVSAIPPGSGMILMSHYNIEAYNNKIKNNKTLGVTVNSWYFTGVPFKSKDYDPFSTSINIHDNKISGNEGPMDTATEFGQLLQAVLNDEPADLVVDGIFLPDSDENMANPIEYCFRNNGTDIKFVNLHAGKGQSPAEIMKNMSTDIAAFDCELSEFDTSDHNVWLASK